MFDEIKRIVDESRKTNNKNGFQIIVKNLDNGEEVVNCFTKAVIGAYETESPEGGGSRRKRLNFNLLQHADAYGRNKGGGRYRNGRKEETYRGSSSGSYFSGVAVGR